jgi:hypothetical protein
MCTGGFFEEPEKAGNKLPKPEIGKPCVSDCKQSKGRWGDSYCYTDQESFDAWDKESMGTAEPEWGAPCFECKVLYGLEHLLTEVLGIDPDLGARK